MRKSSIKKYHSCSSRLHPERKDGDPEHMQLNHSSRGTSKEGPKEKRTLSHGNCYVHVSDARAWRKSSSISGLLVVLLLEPLGGLLGVVGEDHVRVGPRCC